MSKPNFSHIKTHTIDGKRYDVIWKGHKTYSGYCDDRDKPFKRLNIKLDKDSLETLATVAHEVLHISAWSLSEEAVCQFEQDFIRLLRRMGTKIEFQPK